LLHVLAVTDSTVRDAYGASGSLCTSPRATGTRCSLRRSQRRSSQMSGREAAHVVSCVCVIWNHIETLTISCQYKTTLNIASTKENSNLLKC